MKALITGGSGFIGRHLRRHLWSQGVTTINFDLVDDGENDFNYVDVRDVKSVLKAPKVDVVYHLASLIDASDESRKREYLETNVIGTYNVSKLKSKIVFTSSSAIYGDTTYGRTKLIAEEILRINKPDTIRARLYNVVGPESNGVINKFVRAALKGEDIILNGGDQQRDFIYIDDVIRELTSITETSFIGSGFSVCIKDIAQMIQRKTKSSSKILIRERDPKDAFMSVSPHSCVSLTASQIIDKIIEHERKSINRPV